jgi:hypothetical protein
MARAGAPAPGFAPSGLGLAASLGLAAVFWHARPRAWVEDKKDAGGLGEAARARTGRGTGWVGT